MGVTYPIPLRDYRQITRNMGTQLNFDGSGKILTTVTSSYTNQIPITITAWVKTNTVAGSTATTQTICITKFFYVHMRISGGITNLLCRFNNGSAYQSLYPIYRLGQWIHVAAEYRPTSTTTASTYLWINGEMVVANNHSAAALTEFTEGIGGYDTDYFVGKMDDVRIFNTNLSRENVIDIYTGKDILPSNLKLWYKFDEGSGTTATDSSGNGNNGTIGGTISYVTDPPFGLTTRSAATNRNAASGRISVL